MLAEDIKHIIETANGNPIKFVSANSSFVFTKNQFTHVFLDDAKQRLSVIRPQNDPHSDSKYPFEVTYMDYEQIEVATILLQPKDVEKYITDNESKLMYKDKSAQDIINNIRTSPHIKNFDPEPGSNPYSVKRANLTAQPIHRM